MTISWLEEIIPFNEDVGDIYFTSADDAYAASKYLFTEVNSLLERLECSSKKLRVVELGFGTGLNVFMLAKFLEGSSFTLDVKSVEHSLLPRDVISKAVSAWPELSEIVDSFLSDYPTASSYDLGALSLEILQGDVLEVLRSLRSQSVDVWILDGFDPKKNPAMWSDDVFTEVARLSAPGAVASTWCSASAVRGVLTDVGFEVKKVPGFGRKRESLVALYRQTISTK